MTRMTSVSDGSMVDNDAVVAGESSTSARGRVRLGDWLVSHGMITTADVESALAEQRMTGDALGHLLVARGIIDDEELSRALAGVFGIPYRALATSPPAPRAAAR